MKQFKTFIILSLMITISSCSLNTFDKNFEVKLTQLLEEKNYFKLNELLEISDGKIAEEKIFYFSAFVANAFGEIDKSNMHIDFLFSQHHENLEEKLLIKLLYLKAANCLYKYEYKGASEIYSNILSNHGFHLDSLEIKDLQNTRNLFDAFTHVKPQIIHRHKDVKIASYRNDFNHLMTPIQSGGVSEDFIFDTGANLSTISESQAKKMKLTIIEQSIEVGSSTLNNVQSKLAVADSLYVGDILFENVLFLVMPDDQLSFPEIGYQIHGIIGFPVIHQMEEVHLHKDGSISVPNTTQKREFKNMFLDGLNPVVRVFSNSDTLLFTLDTGAKHSELSFKYFNEHKTDVETQGISETNLRGGAGGMAEVNEYILNDFSLSLGSKSIKLPFISVTLEEYAFNKYFDGNLGQDVFVQFNTLIINFRYMYIDFE